MSSEDELKAGTSVEHPKFGLGKVEAVLEDTAIVRFESQLERCLLSELSKRAVVEDRLIAGKSDSLTRVINRMQAETIISANDAWGVFSPSRIALYPHQLWVCNKVGRSWPMRWLVADDVGLGKTVEAGLILWPLITRNRVNRILILSPASIVRQWCSRLLRMFDIRMTDYRSESDGKQDNYWKRHDRVVASFHTLREDRNGRWKRIHEADKWDLVIVDEAHHLNSDEEGGKTNIFRLVESLQNHGKIDSLLFFTGTPHRGKNYAFYALMKLLRPDLFDPEKPSGEQIPNLRKAVIRNNKQTVTDLSGKELFKRPETYSVHYSYSDEEQHFYDQLSEFIAGGKAYAKTLSLKAGSAVGLILATMQKLAASSVAAVTSAMKKRRQALIEGQDEVEQTLGAALNDEVLLEDGEENLSEKLIRQMIKVLEDEGKHLDYLIGLASMVKEETKIQKIIEMVQKEYPDQSVLFFTEYKVTQALLYGKLTEIAGKKQVGFINGDDALNVEEGGQTRRINSDRRDVAANFNSGHLRYLISTEAAGEGIDLQGNCSILIHVDLPWNPMRLHQRVGRINRIGQAGQVKVYNFTNPSTIESRIWDLLDAKIENINKSVGQAMDEPEDLHQIILGNSAKNLFESIFAEAHEVPRDGLKEWFDSKTSTLGGQTAMDMAKDLVGNASKFDYQDTAGSIPKVDIPHLKSFFKLALKINKRRVEEGEMGIRFKTPGNWIRGFIADSYDNIEFRRSMVGDATYGQQMGVGMPLFNCVVEEARSYEDCVSICDNPSLKHPLLAYRLRDTLTGSGDKVSQMLVGLEFSLNGEETCTLFDWELLLKLNELADGKSREQEIEESVLVDAVQTLKDANLWMRDNLGRIDTGFQKPEFECLGVILPYKRTAGDLSSDCADTWKDPLGKFPTRA